MYEKRILITFCKLLLASMVLTACGGGTTTAPVETAAPPEGTEAPIAATEEVGGFQIPSIEEGKFNIAMVILSPHNDGGWGQAHYEGLLYVEDNVPNVHVAYMENIPEAAECEQVFRSLSRKGFDLIIGTSFGYMDAMEIVAGEFPDITYIHITGYKSNMSNYGNLFGAMEDMEYLAGMLAGARAKMDGNPRLGIMLPFPIAMMVRDANAYALGMKVTCPECTMDVRWLNTWHDPIKEQEAAASLLDAGAQVVISGTDTPVAADVAQEKGKWGITDSWVGSCKVEHCLTVNYLNWGPVYAKIAEGVIDGTYQPGWDYFDADSNGLGLYGFMEGQELTPGVAELPPEVLDLVRATLAKMLAGEFNRFDVFSGPITDNQGNIVVPEGEKMTQADLEQFPPGSPGNECTYCMHWFAEGITAELP